MSLLRRLIGRADERGASEEASTRAAREHPASGAHPELDPSTLPDRVALLGDQGRYGAGARVLAESLERAPGRPDVLACLGTLLFRWGRLLEARVELERAHAAGLRNATFLRQLGEARFLMGDLDSARDCLQAALPSAPDDARTMSLLALTRLAQGAADDAVSILQRAQKLCPQDFEAVFLEGLSRLQQGRFAEAESHFRRALAIDGNRSPAWTNLGLSLTRQNRHEEALPAYRRACDLERTTGEDVAGALNLGVALLDAGRLDDAIAALECGLVDRPSAALHFNYAMTLLRAGRLRDGWVHHEYRWLMDTLRPLRLAMRAPVWSGQDLHGKTLMVRAEQGYGDTLHFLRYVPKVKALGATVIVRVQDGLEEVARGCMGVDRVLAQGEDSGEFDYYVHTMTLPRVFGTDLSNVPAEVPYLRVDPGKNARWAAEFAAERRFKVGIVWAGSPGHIKDRYRSTALAEWQPILSVPNLAFYSLQKGPQAAELEALRGRVDIVDLSGELRDFADTAAVAANLDLVICVDTAPAHLVGALGRPVWLLVPDPCDWRWFEGRDDSPWYPSMRLFRQTRRGEWGDVIERITHALRGRHAGDTNVPTAPATAADTARALPSAPPLDRPPFSAVTEARAGIVQYPPDDVVGESLRWYGEYLQGQLNVLMRLLPAGATAIEANAGIGAHALPLALAVGDDGHLLAYEPRPLLHRLLQQNLAANGVRRATVLRRALGRRDDDDLVVDAVDDLGLSRLDMLKLGPGIDVAAVVQGAADSLWKLRPVLAIDADTNAALDDHAAVLREFGYRCWRMTIPLYSPENFNRRTENVFGTRTLLALVAVPEEVEADLSSSGCAEVRA